MDVRSLRWLLVKGAHKLPISQVSYNVAVTSDLIWHKQVPLKVSILAWRLLRDRLLTKDNLVMCDIIFHDSQLCVTGCIGFRDGSPFVSLMSVFCPLWSLVRSWIDISSADSNSLLDHFVQFVDSSGGSRTRRSFMHIIWLLCLGLVEWTK